MESLIIVALLAAIGGAYLVKKQNITSSNSSQQITPPHLLAGAQLLSDQDIANQIGQSSNLSAGDKPRFITECLPMLQAERIVDINNAFASQCKSGGRYQGPPMTLTALKDGKIALQITGVGSAGGVFGSGALALSGVASSVFTAATFGIGAVISIFSIISAHHAAAIRNEQGLECNLIPPVNQALDVIEKAVASGQISIQQGQQALNQLISDFRTQAQNGLSGQLTDVPGKVNAMGWYYYFLKAIIVKKENRYANLVT